MMKRARVAEAGYSLPRRSISLSRAGHSGEVRGFRITSRLHVQRGQRKKCGKSIGLQSKVFGQRHRAQHSLWWLFCDPTEHLRLIFGHTLQRPRVRRCAKNRRRKKMLFKNHGTPRGSVGVQVPFRGRDTRDKQRGGAHFPEPKLAPITANPQRHREKRERDKRGAES